MQSQLGSFDDLCTSTRTEQNPIHVFNITVVENRIMFSYGRGISMASWVLTRTSLTQTSLTIHPSTPTAENTEHRLLGRFQLF